MAGVFVTRSRCMSGYFFYVHNKNGDYCVWGGGEAAFPYHTERGKRNLADRKAALPAVLSDFG